MAGGKGNIRPEDGKQFSSEYQPQEKWTEGRALKVGNELIKWMKAEDENIFFKDFLLLENNYDINLVGYLSKKFSSFYELIENAKNIQEIKLVKFGVFDKLNATMTKFTLINNHNWKDRTEQDITSKGESLKQAQADLSGLTTEELKAYQTIQSKIENK